MTKQKKSIFLKIPFEAEFQTTSSLPNKFWSINEGYIFVLILHGVLTVENFGNEIFQGRDVKKNGIE